MNQLVTQHAWWLASRASGLLALGLVTISVGIGLMMAGRLSSRPGAARVLVAIHEQTALIGLIAIAVHGLTLLGDPWLNPGPSGIAVPFTMAYRPLWTGFGIVGGWLAAILGLSFYARKRIGARLWRKAHRATVVVFVLGVVHTLGAGTDAASPWVLWPIAFATAGITVLFVARVASSLRKKKSTAPARERRPAIEPAPARLPSRRRTAPVRARTAAYGEEAA